MRWSLTYAQAEGALAQIHGANGDAQRSTFRARLKHLKRLGIPRGINPGRGAKIHYFEEQAFEWLFCLELAEFGIDPTIIVQLIEKHWDGDILPRLKRIQARPGADDNPTYFIAHPSLMRAAWSDVDPLPYEWMDQRTMLRKIGRLRRAIMIDVTDLMREWGVVRIAFDSAVAGRKRSKGS